MKCMMLSILLIFGILTLEIFCDIAYGCFRPPSQEKYTIFQPETPEARPGTREMGDTKVSFFCIPYEEEEMQREKLRIQVIIIFLLTSIIRLTYKRVPVNAYHLHGNGKVSIIRYIHLQDGQK